MFSLHAVDNERSYEILIVKTYARVFISGEQSRTSFGNLAFHF